MTMKRKVGRGTPWLRKLDKYLGPIFVVLLALINLVTLRKHRVNCDFSRIDRICLLKTAAIGDTVLLLSVVQALRDKHPHAQIHLFCGPSNYVFAKLMPGLSNVLQLSVTNPLRAIKQLRKQKFDVVLDFGSWPRLDAIYAWLVPAKFRAGFFCAGQFRHYAYDAVAEHSGCRHELENYKNLCKLIDVNDLPAPLLAWAEQDAEVLTRFELLPGKFVLFHLWPGGSRSIEKSWPIHYWLQLTNYIEHKLQCPIVLTGATVDEQRNAEVIALAGESTIMIINAAGIPLKDTISLLSHAKLVVSVDTGVMHIASALKQQLVALHGPTHSERWGGRSSTTRALNACSSIDVAPISLGFEMVSESLMNCITPEQVINEINLILN